MRKLPLSLMLSISVLSTNINADALGLFVGGGVWDHDATGTFGTIGDPIINVESNLNYKSDTDTYVWAAVEHFIPLIPNVRVEAASIGHAGSATNLVFNGATVNGDSSVSLDNIDAILYYRLLDNWVNLDFGLNLRQLDADFIIGAETVSLSKAIPMLYLAAQFDLPLTGLSIGGDISTIRYNAGTYEDIRLRAIYEIGVIGFEAGVKSSRIEFDEVDNITSNLEFTGLIVGAFLHF